MTTTQSAPDEDAQFWKAQCEREILEHCQTRDALTAANERAEKAERERDEAIASEKLERNRANGWRFQAAALAEARERVEGLEKDVECARTGLQRLYKSYVRTLEAGRDRIKFLGGDCDPVERMEQGNPDLIEARALIAALPQAAQQTREG